MAAEEGAAPSVKILRKKEATLPHFSVELIQVNGVDEVYARLPYHILAATPDELAGAFTDDRVGPMSEGKKLFQVRGNVASRIVAMGSDMLSVKESFRLRLLAQGKVAKEVSVADLPGIVDHVFPYGPDLISLSGLVKLLRDKVQGLFRKKLAVRECVAMILSTWFVDLFYAADQFEGEDWAWVSGKHGDSIPMGGDIEPEWVDYLVGREVMKPEFKQRALLSKSFF
mmetsp:Transcript_18281/g.45696  ORF Transcript_18281/g.45696 Transcript_18281/m.45696 type:complete len:227 (-) Transcript_18281:220-900(-)|eukprot:g1909.t1